MLGARPFAIGPGILLASAMSALSIALPDAAWAQSVDYAEMTELFGEPVTTSVTGKPQRASEAPAALIIITRDDIRRSPAQDIPGLIQAYAGIDVARWTAGQSDIAIRGGVQPFNPRLLVLVNGRQAYLDFYGTTNWAGLGVQLAEIQQIEIVKGPNSALFGFNAVSGVINIITVNPLQSQQVRGTIGAGTHGQLFASGMASVKLGANLGLRLSGGYGEADEYRGLGGSVLAPDLSPETIAPRHKEGAAELYARLAEQTEGTIGVSHSHNQQFEVLVVPFTLPMRYDFTSVSGRISHDTGWGVLSGGMLRNWSNIRSQAISGALRFHNKVLVASANALIRGGTANTVRIGAEYRSNALRMRPGYPGATRYDVFAASGMWERQLGDAATFTLAGRVDQLKLEQKGVVDQPSIFTKADFDRSITAWSLNSALLLKLDERNMLRLAAGSGVQLPSLFAFGARFDVITQNLPFAFVTSGNPRLHPARIWSSEVGLTHMFGEDRGSVTITAFYNRTNDIISLGAPQTPPIATPPAYPFVLVAPDNVGSFEAYGVEASMSGRFSPALSWSLNYSWTQTEQRIDGNANGLFAWPLALDSATPKHKIKARLSYADGPWLATAVARYTSAIEQLVAIRPDQNRPLTLVPVSDSLAVDAKLAFKINDKLTVAVSGDNLTGAAGAYLSPVAAERRLRAMLEVGF